MSIENRTNFASPPNRANRPLPIGKICELLGRWIYISLMFIPCMLWSLAKSFSSTKKSLSGNVALVTGAGGSLGRELCLQLAAVGCKVACADIVDNETKETARLVKEKTPGAIVYWYHCDVTSTEDIKRLRAAIQLDLGPVGLLVNNAGIVRGGLISNITEKRLTQIIDVNLKSHFLMIREFLPDMLKNGGHVVAIASMSALYGVSNLCEYAATKHGIFGLMESLRQELRTIPGSKIATTCICPYFIQTEFIKKTTELSMPALSVRINARAIISAIQQNKTVVSIPSFFYYSALLLRLLPDCYADLIRDTFHTKISE